MFSTGKNKSKKKFSALKWWYVVIVFTFLGLIVFGIVNTVRHRQNQNLLTQDLEETGIALDVLARELKKAIPNIEPKRTSDCYRASRKFSEGPIYCAQSIGFSQDNLTQNQVADSLTRIDLALISFEELSFEKRPTDGKLIEYAANSGHEGGGCSAILSKEYNLTGYEFRLECLSGDFDKFIYPERK